MATMITEYSKTEAALAELRSKYANVLYDVSTPAGLKSAKEARAEVKGYRVDLEKLRKEIKAPALQRCQDIDSEAKRITEELRKLEDPIDEQIKQEEARKAAEKAAKEEAERQRVAAIRAKIDEIRGSLLTVAGASSDEICAVIAQIQAIEITADEYAELSGEAMLAQAQTLEQLQAMQTKARDHEAEQARLAAERAELERLRAEQAERDRIAAEQRAEEELQAKAARDAEEARLRAEREAHEAKMRTEREELERQARAAKEAREAEMREFLAKKTEFEQRQQAAQEVAAKPAAPAAEIAPAATDRRPTDQQIIEALALHFRVHESKVIAWLLDMDLEAADQQLAKAV